MSEQEMQRKMEFIVEQQAIFVTDLQKLQEEHAKAESRISRLEGAMVTVVNLMGDLAKAQKITEAKISEMSEKVAAVTARVDKVIERFDELNERLDTFITMTIERFFGDQNGKKKKEK
jgi:predicted  nucleic acid-binding Zn-ribbon protein